MKVLQIRFGIIPIFHLKASLHMIICAHLRHGCTLQKEQAHHPNLTSIRYAHQTTTLSKQIRYVHKTARKKKPSSMLKMSIIKE